MKKLIFLFVAVLFCLNLSAQQSVNRLMDKMKENNHAYAVTLPGWLVRTGLNIASEDELKFEKGFQELVDGIKRLRVLYIDEKVEINHKMFHSIVTQIKEKDGYVDYAKVREEDNLVHVIVKEEGTRIKSLVLMANSDDGFTILNLRTDLEMDDLKKANLSFNKKSQL